jgi:DNA-binding NarL/FixJ family response regulator
MSEKGASELTSREPQSKRIRVLIADDDLMVRQTLGEYLAIATDLELVATCADGAQAVEMVGAQHPDVVLMDIRMPGMDGVTATKQIMAIAPRTRVIALTTFDEDETIAAIFANGGAGFLLKNTRAPALVEAVRAAHSGLVVLPPGLVSRWIEPHHTIEKPTLDKRELAVLAAVAKGLTNRDIANLLFVSPSTVKLQLAGLMRKLNADNRTALVAKAHELGLLAP